MTDTEDYKTGYRHPPRANQYKPGQSGNLAGRGKGARNVSGVIAAALAERVTVTQNGRRANITKLEAAFMHDEGLVEVWKGYHHKRPQTLCRLTDEGRRRFLGYITELENVIADALAAAHSEVVPAPGLAEGWSPA